MARLKPSMYSIIRFIKLLVILLLLCGAFLYVQNYRKDELEKFYLKFDSWGVTQVGRDELQRRAAIDALQDQGVIFVQQEALKNRTVFLGATDQMVLLALGKPIKNPEMNTLNQQVWTYSFDDYGRPTLLYFDKRDGKWILSKAEKSNH